MRKGKVLILEKRKEVYEKFSSLLDRLGYDAEVLESRASIDQALMNLPELILLNPNNFSSEKNSYDNQVGFILEKGPVILIRPNNSEFETGMNIANVYGFIDDEVEEVSLRNTIQLALSKYKSDSFFRKNSRLYSDTLHSISNAVIVTDAEYRVVFMNKESQRLTEWSFELAEGMQIDKIMPLLPQENDLILNESRLKYGSSAKHFLLLTQSGKKIIIETSTSPIFNQEGKIDGYTHVFKDITDQVHSEKAIASLAFYDQLTGLPNRTLFRERLNHALSLAKRNNNKVAILFIDFDGFKNINDTLGHKEGDNLLIDFAKRLKNSVRETDTVARLGGDEFTVILPGLKETKDIITVAEKIRKELAKPVYLSGYELSITSSIGISIFPTDTVDPDRLVMYSDIAMYNAKKSGGNAYHFFTTDMNLKAFERLNFEHSLQKAIQNNELVMYYHPKVNLETQEITGFEALIRWMHPKLGLVPPSKFIPAAVETGIIDQIGEWTLFTACRQMKQWIEEGYTFGNISVNIAGRQFRRSLVNLVEKVLKLTDLPAEYLELEISEADLLEHDSQIQAIMHGLKKLGVTIAIDDFGTGYSSLTKLNKIVADKLKIDKSFLREFQAEQGAGDIIKVIISIAQIMGMGGIAEGVENIEQLNFLNEIGCKEIQGYYISQPLSSQELTEFLSSRKIIN